MNQLKNVKTEYASRELARRHYADYLAYAHGLSWKKTRMSTFLADQVQEFIEADTGHAYDILVVNCPPQHGKSMTITESLPSWYLGKYPKNHVIIASYDSDFAERFCKKNKEKIRNVGQRLFGISIGAIDRAAEFELAPKLTGKQTEKQTGKLSGTVDSCATGGSRGSRQCSVPTDTLVAPCDNTASGRRSTVPTDITSSAMADGNHSHSELDNGDSSRCQVSTSSTVSDGDRTHCQNFSTAKQSQRCQMGDGSPGHLNGDRMRTVPTDMLASTVPTVTDNTAGGRLIARGIMSGITGNPANLVIIDDPVKNQLEADSPTYRQRLWCEWQASIKSRLSAGAKVIIIMTPWREDVFDMEILRTEANVRHIKLPVEAQENDALGRKPGEPLCPELGKDANWLREFRESYINDPLGGQRAWAAMYLCSPRVEDGNLIKRDWWRYYRKLDNGDGSRCQLSDDGDGSRCQLFEKPTLSCGAVSDGAVSGRSVSDGRRFSRSPVGDRMRTVPTDTIGTVATVTEPVEYGTEVISVDAAFKDAELNDFVSIQVWGKYKNDYFLRYCLNRHLNFPDTVEAIRTIAKLYPKARMILIEEAANGAAIIQTLQRELFVLPVTPKGGKVARVNAVSAAIESGHVFVPMPYAESRPEDCLHPYDELPQNEGVTSAPARVATDRFNRYAGTGYSWVNEFLNQWTAFPNGKHDDMVDAGSQALSRLFECSGEVFQIEDRAESCNNNSINLEAMYKPYE